MAQKSDRDQAIEQVAKLLKHNPFSFEIVVKKNPKGIKIIYEVTQEQMDRAMLGNKKANTEV
jgi:hypothetical protein